MHTHRRVEGLILVSSAPGTATMNKTRIYLADDHTILRDGLKHIIHSQPDYEVVGESGDGKTALEEIERLKPDIAILDISMPVMTGIDVTRRLRKYVPEVKIIILSKDDSEEIVYELLKYGIAGYVTKDTAAVDLLAALREALRGGVFLSISITTKIALSMQSTQPGYVDRDSIATKQALSNREKEVLKLLAEGKTSSEIAVLLRISMKTVDAHCLNIKQKLNIHTIPDLVKYAIKQGLIEL